MVKRAIRDVPAWHHLRRYLAIAPDLDYDAGLVDTFLHPLDRAFTVPQLLEFASRNNLKFQSWLDNLDYSISASIMDPQNLLRQRVETLAPAEQWRLVELIAQSLATDRFLLCHPDKTEADYKLDFATDAWLDYVPSLRYPATMSKPAEPEGTAGDGDVSTGMPWSSMMSRLRRLPRGWRRSAEPAPTEPRPLTLSRRWHFLKAHGLRGLLDQGGRRQAANRPDHHGRSAEQPAVLAGGAGDLPPDGGVGSSAVPDFLTMRMLGVYPGPPRAAPGL